MKCSEVLNIIENIAPTSIAYENDNVGLLVGKREMEITGVLCALELDENTVNEAIKIGANLVVAHHPIMYNSTKRVNDDTYQGALIVKAIENGINLYAAHTNLDIAKGGLNDYLCEILGFNDVLGLEKVSENQSIGRFAVLDKAITLKEIALQAKKNLNMEYIKYAGDPNRLVTKVAINTGGGTGCIDSAIMLGADVFLTGDYKYQQAKDCVEAGMSIVDIGHYESEICAIDWFYNLLNGKIDVPLYKSEEQKPTFIGLF